MSEPRIINSSSEEGQKEKFHEKLKRWGKELLSCYKCCKSKGVQEGQEDVQLHTPVRDNPDEASHTYKEQTPPTDSEKDGSEPPEEPPRQHPRRDSTYMAQLQGYLVYNLNTFPFNSFQASNYEALYKEVEKWVKPLWYNFALYEAFLGLLELPKTKDQMQQLSITLQEMARSIKEGKKTPVNKHHEQDSVFNAFSQDPEIKMDEIKSMILVCEAFDRYPPHVVRKARDELPQDKRQRLISFLCAVPYGSGHTFTAKEDYELYRDPDINPIISRSGFKTEHSLSNVIYDPPTDNKAAPIGIAFLLLLGTDKDI